MPGRPLSARPLIKQLYLLRALGLPNANGILLDRRTRLRFDFSVRPTTISREYFCRIELRSRGYDPKAYVLSPDLQALAGGERPPHIYDHIEGITRLCLFYPQSSEWTTQSWLSDTMVPWTISWLRFYEIWLITGKWEGGGEYPDTNPTPPRRRYGMAGRRTQTNR
jgi:hypothetical protein